MEIFNGYRQYYPITDMKMVQGEVGAKAYLVAPCTTVTLWDTESQTIYIKTADASGVPSMQVLEYKVKNAEEKPEYATKAELQEIRQKLDEIMKGGKE